MPGTVANLSNGWSYFSVDYAQKGTYRATADFDAGTLLIEPSTSPTLDDLVEVDILSRWSAGSEDQASTQLMQLGSSDAHAGQAALRATTLSGFDFWLRYEATAPMNATGKGYLGAAVRASNTTSIGWQMNGPVVVIEDTAGARLTLSPNSQYLPIDGTAWAELRAPLAGGNGWVASGAADLTQVRAIELHADTWDYGFTMDIDHVRFTGQFDPCTTALAPTSAYATAKATTATLGFDAVPGAIGYNVYRGFAGAVPTFLGRTRGTVFEDSGLPTSSSVEYRVRPVLAGGYDQYDAVYFVARNLAGYFGGFQLLGSTAGALGTACGVPYPTNDPNVSTTMTWVFTHEFQHAFDYVLATGSGADMINGHPNEIYQDAPYSGPIIDAGEHFDWEGATLRAFTGYSSLAAPHNRYLESLDDDDDGLASSDERLPMSEAKFGTNPRSADTDNDGLSDVAEYYAGLFAASNPTLADTDGDGTRDGLDPTPRAAMASSLAPLTPTIDGVRDAGYTLFRNGVEFTQVSGFTAASYFAYDADYLYIVAEESAPASMVVYIDGSGQNGFWQGDDTYAISLSPNAPAPLNHTEFHGTNGPGVTMPGALLDTAVQGSRTILEARIPRAGLGQGFGWTGAVTDGFSTTKGNVLGLRIWFSSINGVGGLQSAGGALGHTERALALRRRDSELERLSILIVEPCSGPPSGGPLPLVWSGGRISGSSHAR